MRTLKLVLEYDGTDFHGFQAQGEKRTVQSSLEEALSCVFGHPTKVQGAGRTDAGVHAMGQVASTTCDGSVPTKSIMAAVNSMLPDDLAVVQVLEMPEGFNAQKWAKGKQYQYLVRNEIWPSPFTARYVHWVKESLDVPAMMLAAGYFDGTHDWKTFRATGSTVKTSTRTVQGSGIDVIDWHGKTIRFRVSADGFLYNMVRIMAGTLLSVGRGRIRAEAIPEIILSADRKRAGPTLPPNGLCLVEVKY